MHLKKVVAKYSAFIFDLDGTIYLGEQLLPGVIETIEAIRASGRRIIFISNNPTKTREQYAVKLSYMGIPTQTEDIVNSSFVLVQWLLRVSPQANLFVIGEEPIENELRMAGFHLTEIAEKIDIVIASFDHTFTYNKLQIAFDAIWMGARLVATNPDPYCPTPTGGEPDCAAVIGAIEACTGVKCETIVGKPSTIMISTIISLLNLSPDKCMMVGDRLETDIKMGYDAGMDTCLVLTGDATREKLAASEIKPTLVIERIDELLECFD